MDPAGPTARGPTASYADAVRGGNNKEVAPKSKPKSGQGKKVELAPVPKDVLHKPAKKLKDESPTSSTSNSRGWEDAEQQAKPTFSYAAALKGKAVMKLGPKDDGVAWEAPAETVSQENKTPDPEGLQPVVGSTRGRKTGRQFENDDGTVAVRHAYDAKLCTAVTDTGRRGPKPSKKSRSHVKVDGDDTVHPDAASRSRHAALDSGGASRHPNEHGKDRARYAKAPNFATVETPADGDASPELGDGAAWPPDYTQSARRFSVSDLASLPSHTVPTSHPTFAPSSHRTQTAIPETSADTYARAAATSAIYNARMDRMEEVIAAHDRGDIMLWDSQYEWDVLVTCGSRSWRVHHDILSRESHWFKARLPPKDPVSRHQQTPGGCQAPLFSPPRH
ncbi:hypothetical protein BT67DRAFT_86091 [Trichocladium antarcticum]|uniref:BTB domain-containing protein n=1 Tax=Trichocladium antarcticum TaxID=1450529 RepID=A0AAN6UGK2_9PEZI|nr:hypothetical protein BT67DRAFT_86091 [Trichocladium antarcticum]